MPVTCSSHLIIFDLITLVMLYVAIGYELDDRCSIPDRGRWTTYAHVVPRSRMVEIYLHSPMSLWPDA
jgi:hypothetical protein